MKMELYFLLGLFSLSSAETAFSGDQVLVIYPTNEYQAELLRHQGTRVDFWRPSYSYHVQSGQTVDVRVSSADLESFKNLLRDNEIDFEVKIADVQLLADKQVKNRPMSRSTFNRAYDYNIYHNGNEIFDWIVAITDSNLNITTRQLLGTSSTGRAIAMIRISTNNTNPILLVDCGFHAREWISPAFCQCYARKLIENYGIDSEITDTLNRLTIYIIPVLNVDGYAYSWTDNRMWRKTRSPRDGSLCVGVDPNRNFDAGYGIVGSSDDPCSDIYHGPHVESETEVIALATFIRLHVADIKAYVTFHSYGQMILYPYSYTYDLTTTNEQLDHYAAKAQQAVRQKYGTSYTYGPGAATIYPASGGSDDFAYDAGVPLSYTIELRDGGKYGFLLPEDQIQPVCEETYDLMRVMQNAAIEVANGVAKPTFVNVYVYGMCVAVNVLWIYL